MLAVYKQLVSYTERLGLQASASFETAGIEPTAEAMITTQTWCGIEQNVHQIRR